MDRFDLNSGNALQQLDSAVHRVKCLLVAVPMQQYLFGFRRTEFKAQPPRVIFRYQVFFQQLNMIGEFLGLWSRKQGREFVLDREHT